jgi:hypothetical protein
MISNSTNLLTIIETNEMKKKKKTQKKPNKKQKQTNKQTKNKKKKRKIRQYLFKRFINQSPSMSEYTYVDLQFFVRNLGEESW